MLDEILVGIIFFLVIGTCHSLYRQKHIMYEGFDTNTVTDSASDISGAMPKDLSGCAGVSLSKFNADLVLSYISPDIQYAIMSYTIGVYSYLPKIQEAYKKANPTIQMAMSALLARYLAFNGGSAAIPGPGYTNTSPGNYVAQMKGANELLNQTAVDTTSPVYPSFKAAKDVALCHEFNKEWTTTEDF